MVRILKSTKVLVAVAAICVAVSMVMLFRFWIRARHCKHRAESFQQRASALRRRAAESLKVGASKVDVVHFFEENNIPYSFEHFDGHFDARGTLYFPGDKECGSWVCGTDASLIGIEVKVDDSGAVISEPQVITMYTDCL
jgi:hypothetical protein